MNYLKEKDIFCGANSAISYLYGTLLSNFMQKFPNKNQNQPLPTGLKALNHSQEAEKSHIIHSYMLSSSKLPKSSTFSSLTKSSSYELSSSFSDDVLGTESGVCLTTDFEEMNNDTTPYHTMKRNQGRSEATKKEYPPPIPLLARRGNLPGYRPWKLTRRYVDGRLILTEERVKHDEYLEAHRGNGRLILNLVTYRDVEDDEEEELEVEEEEEELKLIEEEENEIKEEEDEEELIKPEYQPAEVSSEAVRIPKSYICCNVNAHRNGEGFMSPISSSPAAIPPMAAVAN